MTEKFMAASFLGLGSAAAAGLVYSLCTGDVSVGLLSGAYLLLYGSNITSASEGAPPVIKDIHTLLSPAND